MQYEKKLRKDKDVMEILEMISEWRRGCSCAGPVHDQMLGLAAGTTNPGDCYPCTLGLIEAIEKREKLAAFNGCITPQFHRVIDRVAEAARIDSQHHKGRGEYRNIARIDLDSLLHEFYRIDALYRRLIIKNETQSVEYIKEEDHRVA